MKSDLVVVVADGGIEQAIRGVLTRHQSIGIRPLEGVEFPKLHRMDQGVYAAGHEVANLYRNTHEHALLVFDFAWEGRPSNDPEQLTRDTEESLRKTWGENGRCVVIVPELEIWIWSDSVHVAKSLGWDTMDALHQWLQARGLWSAGSAKPEDPKRAYEEAIREKQVQKSNSTFNELARKVSFQRCADPSFHKLLGILRRWFPLA